MLETPHIHVKGSAVTVSLPLPLWQRDNYEVRDFNDELRVDRNCAELLIAFRDDLLARGTPPLEAGTLARGADYFLRDFIIDDRRRNLFAVGAREVRQFAGNWYIVRTVEPNLAELDTLLRGVASFYAFAERSGAISAEQVSAISTACADLDFYAARIESFWAISGDGYVAWERACSLKE